MGRRLLSVIAIWLLVGIGVVLGLLISDFSTEVFDDCADRPERLVTFEVIITATPDPNATQAVQVITATPVPGQPECVFIPEEVRDETLVPGAPVPTIPPSAFGENGLYLGDPEALPEGCLQHVVAEGENPSLIAVEYDVSLYELLAVNRLDEESALLLQIGDVLIVPMEGCPLEAFIAPTEEGTEPETAATPLPGEATPEVTVEFTPTLTLAPTAANAQVEIVDVIGAGDITTEGVVIRNNGNTVDISGWMLSDGDGNVFIFPEGRRLFSGAGITVNTRVGENTPILFFWGRDTAVFSAGDVVVLTDRDGYVQASIRLPDAP